MKTNSEINKRKVGGFGLASSMIRSNMDTEDYLKHIINVINYRLFENQEILSYRLGHFWFELRIIDTRCSPYEDFPLDHEICIEEDFIEYCRGTSVTKLERVIIEHLIKLGYQFDTNNEYYRAVFK